jgi:hypothetical protein
MTKRKKIVLASITGAAVAAIGVIAYALLSMCSANDLGLTAMDMTMGAPADFQSLCSKTKAAADAHLAEHQAALTEACGSPVTVTLDYSLSSRIRSLGYRSSFYYYCWDIYLPYSVTTEHGKKYIVVVQLSDAVKGNEHNPDKFTVLRMMLVNDTGQTIKTIQ